MTDEAQDKPRQLRRPGVTGRRATDVPPPLSEEWPTAREELHCLAGRLRCPP